jgi:hydroxyacylglutathione hydrolase
VLDTPGHSPGHVSFWRESDGVLILGDVLNAVNVTTGIRDLHEPPGSSPRTRRRTAARRAGWRPSSRSSRSSATARRYTRKLVEFVDGLG